jgi:transposase
MPREEQIEPRSVRNDRIIALARKRRSVREIARELGIPKSTVQEVVRRWRDPSYRREEWKDSIDEDDRQFLDW